MFLLIVAIIGIAAALYFLFINKKDTNTQTEALLQMMGKAENPKSKNLNSKSEEPADDEPEVPTDEEWKEIYAISEKIYFKKPLTIHEKKVQKEFDSYMQKDIEYCNEFYPVVDKMVAGVELNITENEFYEANKEDVDKEVYFRNLKAVTKKLSSKEELNEREKEFYEANKEKVSTKLSLYIDNNNKVSELTNLAKANPPGNIEERNKKILSLFEDGIPKSVPQIKPLYMKATGHDPGKNLYRIFGKLEGKFLTPYKDGNITYYCLPEWFDGRKLKSEFKKKIN